MSFTKKVTEQRIPNPEGEGGWYWYKKSKDARWEPVYVIAATKSWPACMKNDIHSRSIEQATGEWGDFIPAPVK